MLSLRPPILAPSEQRLELIEEARRWVRTPYLLHHAILGYGVDCWTLPSSVGKARGVLTIDPDLWAPFADYGDQPSPRMVRGCAETFLTPTLNPQPGDVALIAWRPGLAMHFALLGQWRERLTLIHALRTNGGAVEHGFTAEWPSLVDSWWRYPGVID